VIDVRSKVAAEVLPVDSPADGDIVLVKQQGAMRTGTNLVKFALDENFTDVRVLVNIGRIWPSCCPRQPRMWRAVALMSTRH